MSAIMGRRRVGPHRSAVGNGSSLWDDPFSTGSSIDTAGTRFASAKPWTKQNFGTSTDSVSGGQLTIVTQGSGNLHDPRVATQSLSGAGSAWRFRLGIASLSTDANYNGLGMIVRESATAKMLCFGLCMDAGLRQVQIRISNATYPDWDGNTGTVATSPPYYTGELEIELSGSNLIFRRLESGVWAIRATLAIATYFTTAPDQIGLWANGPVSTAATAVFDYWQKVA